MKYIDLRSDTVTEPTEEMKRAMVNCEVGDDVYDDDPTMKKLEEMAAKMLGKESAVFVPTGTMGNQLAIMTHTRRGDEIILSNRCHVVMHECGGAAVLSQASYCIVDNENGFVYADDVKKSIRDPFDIHYPQTGLICLENALGNGRVVPLQVMSDVYKVARENNIPVHLDGARIFNAATALNVDASEIAACVDSVQFCLSKGLCAPVGSMLCGTKEFVAKARRNRKLLGGGMRQVGILAACGIIALETMTKRLNVDHENAKYMAAKLDKLAFVDVDMSSVEINMVFFKINKADFKHDAFVQYMFDNNVKINAVELGEYRFVAHNYITKENIDAVIGLMEKFDK